MAPVVVGTLAKNSDLITALIATDLLRNVIFMKIAFSVSRMLPIAT